MTYGGINYIAVLAATGAALLAGLLWYSLFSARWMIENGMRPATDEEKSRVKLSKTPVVVAGLATFLTAFCLAKLMEVLDAVSISNGIALALFLWIGFVATTISVNHRFEGRSWRLTFIDTGYWLVVLLLQATIIGFLA